MTCLSNSVLKLFERLVNWRLKTTILNEAIPRQHAFTLGRSTESALSEVTHVLEKAKMNGMYAMVLSVDVQGAFDTVSFDAMRDALIEHDTEPELTRWLDYLARNRSVEIKEGDSIITFRPLEGTTQGGHNGPDLWNVSIWDLITLKLMKHCFVCKYADDILAIIVGVDLDTMRLILQRCLNEIQGWLTGKGLTISASKSFCMIINQRRNQTPTPLRLGEDLVPHVDSFKYLGVIFDKNLSWKEHILSRTKKAKRDLMVARRLISISWGLTPNRMKWLYEGVVRPSLDYACHV